MSRPLRFVTHLAPSLPAELFAGVVEQVGRALGVPVRLALETATSGPVPGVRDPFTADEVDVGFMCAPSYLWLRGLAPPPVELAGAGLVFADPRAAGRPIYFSDVVVARGSRAERFADLQGGVWAYNDPCSLSGHWTLLDKLSALGLDRRFFRGVVQSGAHLRSLAMVASGEADAAAIDSNVLALALKRDPMLGVRVLETWGPYPIQPVVVRAALAPALKRELRDALLAVGELAEFGLQGFAPVDEAHYDVERATLARCAPVDWLLSGAA